MFIFALSFILLFFVPSRDLHESNLLSHKRICGALIGDGSISKEPNHDTKELTHVFSKMLDSAEKGIVPHQEEVELINFGTDENKKELWIVDNSEREEKIALFSDYLDVFAWSYQDMSGIDHQITAHRIPLYPEIPPKK